MLKANRKTWFAISIIRPLIALATVLFLLCPAQSSFPSSQEMVNIPSGEFLMGDTLNELSPGERPVHSVKLDSFCIGRCEVTNQEYCEGLNWAKSQNLVYVSGGIVYGSGNNLAYCDTKTSSSDSQITWNGRL